MTPSQIPEGAVVITTAQMYVEQQATTAAVVRLEGKLDNLTTSLATESTKGATDHVDHEARIRALEHARWPLPSLAVLISVAAIITPFLVPGH